MKKKIKDLTLKDLNKNFCGKVEDCYYCSIRVIAIDGECWCKYDLLTVFGDEEIEVEEDD